MSKFWIVALLLLAGSVFADVVYQECYSSSDCPDNEYCNGNGQCVQYGSGGNNASCCGTGAILLAAIGLGAFVKYKRII